MSTELQIRGASTATRIATIPALRELYVDTTLSQLFVGDGVTAGGNLAGGLLTANKTTTYSVLATDTGIHFNNAGAGGSITFNLPAAASNLRYGFLVYAAQNITVAIAGGDLIKSDVFSGASISCATQWSFLELEAHGSGFWIITKATGAWG